MNVEQLLKIYVSFRDEIIKLKQQYLASKNPEELEMGIRSLSENPGFHPYADLLLLLGESYIDSGDYPAGITCIRTTEKFFPYVNNKTILYLRLAEYHIESGSTETGIDYLVKLCTQVSESYEMHIALNGLTSVWEKYKPLVAGKVPESVAVAPPLAPLSPEKCSRTIGQILASPKEELLSQLSQHLIERTANGTCLNWLNRWERVFFYADELTMEVNSGGFGGYLYYHGTHFPKASQAFAQLGAHQTVNLLAQVQSKFPRASVPKSEAAIQNAMDRMEEKGIDFEAEDEAYYSSAEKELLECLYAYVQKNRRHFR